MKEILDERWVLGGNVRVTLRTGQAPWWPSNVIDFPYQIIKGKKLHRKRLSRLPFDAKKTDFNYGRGRFWSEKCQMNLHYRSMLELQCYSQLENDGLVRAFFVEPLTIRYLFRGRMFRYHPDLVVVYANGTSKVIEVKPMRFIGFPRNLAKFKAAVDWCAIHQMQFEVWSDTRRVPLH